MKLITVLTSLILQVLNPVKDGGRRRGDKQGHGKSDMGTRGVPGATGWSEPTKSRGSRSASSDREDTHGHKEQRSGSEKKVGLSGFLSIF